MQKDIMHCNFVRNDVVKLLKRYLQLVESQISEPVVGIRDFDSEFSTVLELLASGDVKMYEVAQTRRSRCMQNSR
jgi:hypothetical protein